MAADFTGKVAVVTGGAQGIGQCIADELRRAGARLSVFDKLEGGEAIVGPYYAGDAVIMIEENPDLAFAFPKEGTNLFVDAMCVPTCCANYDNAMAFINFMCRDDIVIRNCEETWYSAPSSTALTVFSVLNVLPRWAAFSL